MKKIVIILSCFFSAVFASAQNKIEVTILSAEDIKELFSDEVKETYKLSKMPIFKAYKIVSKYKNEPEYLMLCESHDQIKGKDTISKKLYAALLRHGGSGGIEEKIWEIKDNIIASVTEETSISFYTRYLTFEDFDNDGEVDHTLIYGTRAMNGLMDGRLKIAMINNKGQKIFIRHQNGVLDSERETKIDAAFYNLPRVWQYAVQKRIVLMQKEERAIFPAGWEAGVRAKKLIINER
jgi:hypothetical protein